MTANLHIIPKAPPPISAEEELVPLLERIEALRGDLRDTEQAMRPLMRRYADERGEKMLPTAERLRRELL